MAYQDYLVININKVPERTTAGNENRKKEKFNLF